MIILKCILFIFPKSIYKNIGMTILLDDETRQSFFADDTSVFDAEGVGHSLKSSS